MGYWYSTSFIPQIELSWCMARGDGWRVTAGRCHIIYQPWPTSHCAGAMDPALSVSVYSGYVRFMLSVYFSNPGSGISFQTPAAEMRAERWLYSTTEPRMIRWYDYTMNWSDELTLFLSSYPGWLVIPRMSVHPIYPELISALSSQLSALSDSAAWLLSSRTTAESKNPESRIREEKVFCGSCCVLRHQASPGSPAAAQQPEFDSILQNRRPEPAERNVKFVCPPSPSPPTNLCLDYRHDREENTTHPQQYSCRQM